MRFTFLVIVSALIVCMEVCALNVQRGEETSGTCGENLEWRLDGTTLYINGTGNMTDFDMSSAPWSSLSFDTVEIQSGVKSIGVRAFLDCRSLINVTIPESVVSIGSSAFCHCTKLTEIIIPAAVKLIGKDVFRECTALTSIEVEDGNTNYASRDGVLFDHDFITIVHYPSDNPRTEYVFPDTVKFIEDYAFAYCSSLKTVTFGDSVTTIGIDSFSNCPALASVTIGNNVKSIGSYAFYSCKALATLKLGKNVQVIMEDAFYGCESLETITIPDNVVTIGKYAFGFCSKLKSVTFGNGLLEIEDDAFTDCRSLININIPDSVTTIGKEVFAYCPGLTTITIGANVSSIGDGAFSVLLYNNNLTNVYYKSRHPISNSLFSYSHLVNVCVPSDYESTLFGGVNVTNTTTCHHFQSMLFNYCYTPIGIDDTLTQVKRQNATEFERRSNGCVEYRCNNETEPSITALCKGDKPFCIQAECRAENSLDGFKVRVELELKQGVSVNLIDENEIKYTLQNQFGLGADDVAIGYQLDDEGDILFVSLYLKDMEKAKVIVDSVNNDENPTGFFRLIERARIYGPEMFLSGTERWMSSMLSIVCILSFVLLV